MGIELVPIHSKSFDGIIGMINIMCALCCWTVCQQVYEGTDALCNHVTTKDNYVASCIQEIDPSFFCFNEVLSIEKHIVLVNMAACRWT